MALTFNFDSNSTDSSPEYGQHVRLATPPPLGNSGNGDQGTPVSRFVPPPSPYGSSETVDQMGDHGINPLLQQSTSIENWVASDLPEGGAEIAAPFAHQAAVPDNVPVNFAPCSTFVSVLFCSSTAIQATFASMAVGDYFSTGSKCDVGDLGCYIVPKGEFLPGLNIGLAVLGLLANTAIAYVFLPLTYLALKRMYQESRWTKSIGGAILFASAAAAVSYQLSRDSFKLGDHRDFWQSVNWTLIILAVIPTFCSRFTGSQRMLNMLWRIKLQALTFFSYFYLTDDPLAWAVTIENDLRRSAYTLPKMDLEKITDLMKDKNYLAAFQHFYKGQALSNDLEGAMQNSSTSWKGLNVTPVRSAIYWATQFVFFCISMLSSCIIYNIIFNLTGVLAAGLAEVVTGFCVLPATFYYLYSLSRLPDSMFRAHALAYQVSTTYVWLLYLAIYIVAIGSCGNLLYSGITQGLAGDFDWTGWSPESATVIFGITGGCISSLCNLFALLDIFERIVTANFGLAEVIKNFETQLDLFIAQARLGAAVKLQPDTLSPMQEAAEPLMAATEAEAPSAKRKSIAAVKEFYAGLPFFQQYGESIGNQVVSSCSSKNP